MSGSRLSRISVALLVAASLSAWSAIAVTAVDDAAYNTNCSSTRICIYKNSNLTVPLATTCNTCNDAEYTDDSYPNGAGNLNDSMTSAVNYKTSGKVLWYPNVFYDGTPFCLDHGIAALYVGSGFDNRASSHLSISGSC